MKAVLLSIQPEHCAKIARGEKTIEVRKTRPKLPAPFKCYIYETEKNYIAKTGVFFLRHELLKPSKGRGVVIGEFICKKVTAHEVRPSGAVVNYWANDLKKSCLTIDEIAKYAGNSKTIYGWNISDLKIYDTPRELGEFFLSGDCNGEYGCIKCKNFLPGEGWLDGSTYEEDDCKFHGIKPLTRPPQSWCYVEEL